MNSSNEVPLSGRLVQVDHRHIHVAEYGAGHPLLLLHGGGPGASGLSNYARNIEELARRFRVIVVDMPGYGQSSKGVDRSDPFGDLARSMLGLLDVLGIAGAHIVGNSLGGACGLRMALEAPQRVSALVLMGPGGVNTTRSLPTRGLNLLLDYYKGQGPTREKLNRFIRDYLVHEGAKVSEEAIEARFQASIDPEVVAAPPLRRPNSLGAAIRMDFTRDHRLKSLATPTLVLWGSEDKVNRPSGAEALRRRLPNCDVHLFGRTGHWVQWERPEEFNALVAAFLAQHCDGEASRP